MSLQIKMSKSHKNRSGASWPSFNKMPIPDEMWVTLRYAENLDATATLGGYSYVYAANDVYDPNVTGTGSQPLSYDQWTAMYARWVVLMAEIEVVVTSRTVSGRLSVAVVPVTAASFYPTTYEAACQMRYAKMASTTGGGPSPKIVVKIKMNDLYGVPLSTIQSDDAFAGAAGSSPNRRMAFAIAAETSGASDALSLAVNLRYKVRFYQPNLYSVSFADIRARTLARAAAHSERADNAGPEDSFLASLPVSSSSVPSEPLEVSDFEEPAVAVARLLNKIQSLELQLNDLLKLV